MGRKRKMTKAQLRMRYYNTTKRLGAIHHPYYDNRGMMPPYPFAPPPSYLASSSSYPTNAYGRRFSAPPSCHIVDLNSQDIDIPAAVTKEEEDDPKSLDNKRLIANSEPSTELEVALKAELDKQVKHNELISAELDKLRHVLSRIQAHQSNEPLPPHGASLHTALSRKDREEQKPPQQPTKKGPRNGYNMFYSKVAPELKGTLNSYKDLAKVISEKWKALSKEEKDNYELDAEIFNIMDDRDTRDSNNDGGDDQHLNEQRDQCDSYDDRNDDQHQYYPTNPPYQYQYDMTIPPPPGPPPGPPPPGMLFDLSFPPPPPPPPGYDYSYLPPPPPNDMFGGSLPPPPPTYPTSALNFTDVENDKKQASSRPDLLSFTLHGSPPSPINRTQSLPLNRTQSLH